jgi:lipoyl(octanoyl) transferase
MTSERELFSGNGWQITWLGRVPYAPALARQEALVAAKISDPARTPDTLLLLEHEPVYTIGRTPDRSSLASAAALPALPYPVETIHRGGQATYHGPGQLIGYPIIDLTRRQRDLHRYLRALEEVLIRTLAACAITGRRREGLTGVWVGEQKIASIGVGVRRWMTLHGFALNVLGGAALRPFDAITPCGISGVKMASVQDHATGAPSVESVATILAGEFPGILDERLPLESACPKPASQPAHEQQDHENDQDQPQQTAARSVAPRPAMRPRGQRS